MATALSRTASTASVKQPLSEADEKFQKGKEDRAGVQKKTFTKRVNSHLTKVGTKAEELYEDLKDGTKLIKLLEIISGEQLPKPDKGRGRFVMVGNLNKALKFLAYVCLWPSVLD